MKIKSTLRMLAFAGILMCTINVNAQTPQHRSSACDLKSDMRKLWEDHITWTRNVIFNILDALPGTNEAVARLLQNQDDIGAEFGIYYGTTAGNTLAGLLHGHITTAAALLIALHNNDAAGLAAANAAWYANGDSIVDFLASLNPNWSQADLDMMMDSHLDLTTNEALARFNHNYTLDVQEYDSVHTEILAMSDFFTDGIVAQFPRMFRPNSMRFASSVTLSDQAVVLDQNSPNPFSEKTVISYFIPENIGDAQLVIYNQSGAILKTIPITNRGDGDLTVYASALSSGIFSYSIIADGKIIDTKKMIH